MEGYNGWKNYETWNVALWLGNDEGLYNIARKYTDYNALARELKYQLECYETPDGVAWTDSALDIEELNDMLIEF